MRPAERNVKNREERKKPAGMAFVWGHSRIGGRPGSWRNLLAGLKSPHGPDEDK